MNIILVGSVASLLAGLATSFRALPLFFINRVSKRVLSFSLGISSGIMLSASFF